MCVCALWSTQCGRVVGGEGVHLQEAVLGYSCSTIGIDGGRFGRRGNFRACRVHSSGVASWAPPTVRPSSAVSDTMFRHCTQIQRFVIHPFDLQPAPAQSSHSTDVIQVYCLLVMIIIDLNIVASATRPQHHQTQCPQIALAGSGNAIADSSSFSPQPAPHLSLRPPSLGASSEHIPSPNSPYEWIYPPARPARQRLRGGLGDSPGAQPRPIVPAGRHHRPAHPCPKLAAQLPGKLPKLLFWSSQCTIREIGRDSTHISPILGHSRV